MPYYHSLPRYSNKVSIPGLKQISVSENCFNIKKTHLEYTKFKTPFNTHYYKYTTGKVGKDLMGNRDILTPSVHNTFLTPGHDGEAVLMHWTINQYNL